MNQFLKMGSEGKIPDLLNIPKPPAMGEQNNPTELFGGRNNPPEISNCFIVKVNTSGKVIEVLDRTLVASAMS